MPAEGNGDLQTLICVLVARPRRCLRSQSPSGPCGAFCYLGHFKKLRMIIIIIIIVESCPLTKLNGGLSRLHSADEDAVSWLTSYGS